MSKPLSDQQRIWLADYARSDLLGLGIRRACRAALDRIDHLEAVNADLYAVLRVIVDYYEGAGIGPCPEGQDDDDDPDGFDADERYNVRRARAALAKARGEVTS